jgi:hypothetical protein
MRRFVVVMVVVLAVVAAGCGGDGDDATQDGPDVPVVSLTTWAPAHQVDAAAVEQAVGLDVDLLLFPSAFPFGDAGTTEAELTLTRRTPTQPARYTVVVREVGADDPVFSLVQGPTDAASCAEYAAAGYAAMSVRDVDGCAVEAADGPDVLQWVEAGWAFEAAFEGYPMADVAGWLGTWSTIGG